jgi:photosystem II stability/assembly factor-like uncharacterized protein
MAAFTSKRSPDRRSSPARRRRSVWLPLFVSALLAPACHGNRSGGPVLSGPVEGGILPAEEDYYATDVVDPNHAWIVGSYGAAIALGDKGGKAELRPVPSHEPLFCVTFRDPSTGVIGARGGRIFRTTDGGKTWASAATADAKENVLDIARTHDPQRLWAVGPRGMILRSSDDGATWQDHSLGKDITLNAVTFVDDREGWIVGEFGTILQTTDGGETWERSEDIEGLPPYAEDVSEEVALRLGIPPLSKDDLYLFDVAFVTPDTGYVVGAGGFVLTTVDRGRHWTAAHAGTRNTLFKIVPTPIGSLIGTGILGTLVRHGKEGWKADEDISHRLFTWIRGLDFSTDGALGVAVGGKGAVLLSRDRGETWEILPRERLQNALPRRSS